MSKFIIVRFVFFCVILIQSSSASALVIQGDEGVPNCFFYCRYRDFPTMDPFWGDPDLYFNLYRVTGDTMELILSTGHTSDTHEGSWEAWPWSVPYEDIKGIDGSGTTYYMEVWDSDVDADDFAGSCSFSAGRFATEGPFTIYNGVGNIDFVFSQNNCGDYYIPSNSLRNQTS